MAWTELITRVSVATHSHSGHFMIKGFTDPYALDAHMLGGARPPEALLNLVLDIAINARIVPCLHRSKEEYVVLESALRSCRFHRATDIAVGSLTARINARNGSVQGIGLYFDVAARHRLPVDHRIILLMGDPLIASIVCRPRRLSPNDSVAELVYDAELCLRSRLLRHLYPDLAPDKLLLPERPP
ncbi:MAG: hypothetical protein ACOC4E_03230 [Patescibacteria group bacterium]